MKAIIHTHTKGYDGLEYTEIETPAPKAGEVLVKMKHAGLNHRDLFVLGRHKESEPPFVVGSDGAGIIAKTAGGVSRFKEGDEVIIHPGTGWKEKSPAPPAGFDITGYPGDGTFSEYMIVKEDEISAKPVHLGWSEAGVLALAGLTAYRALFTRGGLEKGQTVFIPGSGSGVATYLIQFAKAAGATVITSSRNEEKRKKAETLGADLAIDSNGDWEEVLKDYTIDLVIESVGAATFNKSLGILKKGGTLVIFGASAGDEVKLDLRGFFYGQYNLLGSTMGSAEELDEMLAFIGKHGIRPVVDSVYPLAQTLDAMKHLEEGNQFGKIALLIDKEEE